MNRSTPGTGPGDFAAAHTSSREGFSFPPDEDATSVPATDPSKEEPMMGVNSAATYEFNGMLHYPFPLSTGQIATIDIPKRLEAEDAERLAEFILTLAKGDE